MPRRIRQSWTEIEEARKAVRGALAGAFAFRALLKTCKKLMDVIQAAEDMYVEEYAGELEEFTKTGDMKDWYGQFKGG